MNTTVKTETKYMTKERDLLIYKQWLSFDCKNVDDIFSVFYLFLPLLFLESVTLLAYIQMNLEKYSRIKLSLL